MPNTVIDSAAGPGGALVGVQLSVVREKLNVVANRGAAERGHGKVKRGHFCP